NASASARNCANCGRAIGSPAARCSNATRCSFPPRKHGSRATSGTVAAAYSAFANTPGGLLSTVMTNFISAVKVHSGKGGRGVAIAYRPSRAAAAALVAALSLALPASAEETPKPGGTLTYLVPADAPP